MFCKNKKIALSLSDLTTLIFSKCRLAVPVLPVGHSVCVLTMCARSSLGVARVSCRWRIDGKIWRMESGGDTVGSWLRSVVFLNRASRTGRLWRESNKDTSRMCKWAVCTYLNVSSNCSFHVVFCGMQVWKSRSCVHCVKIAFFHLLSLIRWAILRTFALIVSAHPHCARKFTCHVMHRARALSTKTNNDRADSHCYSFAWI